MADPRRRPPPRMIGRLHLSVVLAAASIKSRATSSGGGPPDHAILNNLGASEEILDNLGSGGAAGNNITDP